MRKIYNIIILLAGLTFFGACTTDLSDHPVVATPGSFVLNTPTYVSGIYDLRNTETVLLTTSQPNYGFTAATTYSVQVSTESSFTDFATLPTSYTTARMEVSASEMATVLVGLLGITEEADFPTDPFPVYIRLAAVLTDNTGQVLSNTQTLSNIIELPQVLSYFALPSMTMPDNIYLTGNVVGNWDWAAANAMIPVNGTPGQFWCIQYLGKTEDGTNANAEIKFNTARAWDGNDFGMKTAAIDDASKTLAGISGDDNIVIGNPGWYIVEITTEISGRDYIYHVQFLPPNVYLCGNAAGGVWGAGDNNLFTVPDISLGSDANFVSPAFIGNAVGMNGDTDVDGGVRACVVLVADWWRTEFMVFSNVLQYRGNGSDQMPRVSGSIGQKLYINFTEGTGKIE